MSQTRKHEESLVLKAEFGGSLEPGEPEALQRFLATPEGHAYRDGVLATRRLVREDGATSVQAGALAIDEVQSLRTRFETTLHERAGSIRERMRGFVLLSFGITSAFSLFFGHILPRFHPKQPGPGDVLSLWIVGYVGAALFCAYMLYRLHEMQRAPDLFDRLTGRARRVPRTLAAHLRRTPIMILLVMLVAREEGWVRASVAIVSLWIVFALAAHYLRRRQRRERMGKDPELWSWRYGELDRDARHS